jgi:hypothetical protein
MLPPIASVNSVEMIRDGGSLAASFQGANGSEYWLFLQLEVGELPTGESERLGYATPVVVERAIGQEVEISWDHAKVLLNQMRPMLRKDADQKWLETMYASVEGNGALPPGVERFLGQSTRLGE